MRKHKYRCFYKNLKHDHCMDVFIDDQTRSHYALFTSTAPKWKRDAYSLTLESMAANARFVELNPCQARKILRTFKLDLPVLGP